MFSFDHIVSEYIIGDVMLKSTSWVDVENILFPIYIKSQQHWVLGRLSIKDWCIYLYNSLKGARDNIFVVDVIKCYSVMLPIFLKRLRFFLIVMSMIKDICALKLLLICLFRILCKDFIFLFYLLFLFLIISYF